MDDAEDVRPTEPALIRNDLLDAAETEYAQSLRRPSVARAPELGGRCGLEACQAGAAQLDVAFRADGYYTHTGRSVAPAGDLDGEGFDDFLIGAALADPLGDVAKLGMLAADCTARAIARGVYEADGLGDYPGYRTHEAAETGGRS